MLTHQLSREYDRDNLANFPKRLKECRECPYRLPLANGQLNPDCIRAMTVVTVSDFAKNGCPSDINTSCNNDNERA